MVGHQYCISCHRSCLCLCTWDWLCWLYIIQEIKGPLHFACINYTTTCCTQVSYILSNTGRPILILLHWISLKIRIFSGSYRMYGITFSSLPFGNRLFHVIQAGMKYVILYSKFYLETTRYQPSTQWWIQYGKLLPFLSL